MKKDIAKRDIFGQMKVDPVRWAGNGEKVIGVLRLAC